MRYDGYSNKYYSRATTYIYKYIINTYMYMVYLYQRLKDTEVYLHTYILGMDVQLYFSDVIFKKTSLPVVLPFFLIQILFKFCTFQFQI